MLARDQELKSGMLRVGEGPGTIDRTMGGHCLTMMATKNCSLYVAPAIFRAIVTLYGTDRISFTIESAEQDAGGERHRPGPTSAQRSMTGRTPAAVKTFSFRVSFWAQRHTCGVPRGFSESHLFGHRVPITVRRASAKSDGLDLPNLVVPFVEWRQRMLGEGPYHALHPVGLREK